MKLSSLVTLGTAALDEVDDNVPKSTTAIVKYRVFSFVNNTEVHYAATGTIIYPHGVGARRYRYMQVPFLSFKTQAQRLDTGGAQIP